ncbi:hypothetical protein B0G81_3414 [Paraburkholderia sp. BL6665CI2N2]|nr:hypothetical protein B0G81_3414 [Paraburkholderia sp. BL6665CI2N2]
MTTLNPASARVLKRLHYPLDMILPCVRWYVAYPLSLRHLEEMMAERGISVDTFNCVPLGHQGLAGLGEGLSPPQESRRSELANG